MFKLIAICIFSIFIFAESCVTAFRPQSGKVTNDTAVEPTVVPSRSPCSAASPKPTPGADGTDNRAIEALRRGAGSNKVPWQPAIFRGLRIGSTHIDALVAELGKPMSIADDGTYLIYRFEICDGAKGFALAWVDPDSMTVKIFVLNPESMTWTEILKTFGDDYVITRYDSDLCLTEGDGAPIYENPNGSLEYVEYRSMGIAVFLPDDGRVQQIEYLEEPPGTQFSRCP